MGRAEHIRRRADFQKAYQQGARLQGRYMTIFVLSTELPVARLGITATRKLGGSVKRNYAKRLIREVFRRHKPAPGTDLVVVPRATVAEALFSRLEADYCQTLTQRRTARVV
jgi:ribonuclease P protein component